MLGAAVMGMEYHVVTPKELEPTKETLDKANEIAKETGAKIVVTNDIKEGVKGMDVIYADVWVSMGESDDMWEKRIKLLKPYQVTMDVMKATENLTLSSNTVCLHSTTWTLKLVVKSKRSLALRKWKLLTKSLKASTPLSSAKLKTGCTPSKPLWLPLLVNN